VRFLPNRGTCRDKGAGPTAATPLLSLFRSGIELLSSRRGLLPMKAADSRLGTDGNQNQTRSM